MAQRKEVEEKATNEQAQYEGAHDIYSGVHHQYPGVHEAYDGVHDDYPGVNTETEAAGEATVAPGMRDFLEKDANKKEIKEGDFTKVTTLSYDETH